MHVLSWMLAATPDPSQTQLDPSRVTPGFAGFVATALIAIVAVLLVVDMLRRVRKSRYRVDVREQLDAEERAAAANDAAANDATADEVPASGDDATPRNRATD